MLRKQVKEFAANPGHACPGHGRLAPEQLEIDRFRRDVVKLKAERDIPTRRSPLTLRRIRYEVRLHRDAPRNLAGGMDVPGARCLAKAASRSGSPEHRRSAPAMMR